MLPLLSLIVASTLLFLPRIFSSIRGQTIGGSKGTTRAPTPISHICITNVVKVAHITYTYVNIYLSHIYNRNRIVKYHGVYLVSCLLYDAIHDLLFCIATSGSAGALQSVNELGALLKQVYVALKESEADKCSQIAGNSGYGHLTLQYAAFASNSLYLLQYPMD